MQATATATREHGPVSTTRAALRRLQSAALWRDRERRVLEAAAALADPEGRVCLWDLATATDLSYRTTWPTVRRLKVDGRWPYRPPPSCVQPAVRRDPADVAAGIADVFARRTERCGDGRDEVDDPVEHGRLAVPWSGRIRVRRTVPLWEVCLAFRTEWARVRERTSPGRILVRERTEAPRCPS